MALTREAMPLDPSKLPDDKIHGNKVQMLKDTVKAIVTWIPRYRVWFPGKEVRWCATPPLFPQGKKANYFPFSPFFFFFGATFSYTTS